MLWKQSVVLTEQIILMALVRLLELALIKITRFVYCLLSIFIKFQVVLNTFELNVVCSSLRVIKKEQPLKERVLIEPLTPAENSITKILVV
jgi:hypothetical protein